MSAVYGDFSYRVLVSDYLPVILVKPFNLSLLSSNVASRYSVQSEGG